MLTHLRERVSNRGNESEQNLDSMLSAIECIRRQLYHERDTILSSSANMPILIAKSKQPNKPTSRTVSDLDRSIERLETIKQWLTEDNHLLALVDDAINRRVQEMEHHSQHLNIQLALVTTVGGALLGWLLAAISSPHDLLRLLGL